MWKLQRVSKDKLVSLKLIGRIEAHALPDLRSALATEGHAGQLVLDLSEIELAGYDAVAFLAECEERGAQLRNCPAYLREWIARARNKGNQK